MKIANIDREFLHIFWTTWGNSIKFSGKMFFKIILKVTRNQGCTLSIEDREGGSIWTLPIRYITVKMSLIKNLLEGFLITYYSSVYNEVSSSKPKISISLKTGKSSNFLNLSFFSVYNERLYKAKNDKSSNFLNLLFFSIIYALIIYTKNDKSSNYLDLLFFREIEICRFLAGYLIIYTTICQWYSHSHSHSHSHYHYHFLKHF